MTGLFPTNGTTADLALNAQVMPPANVAPGCDVRYNPTNRCVPKFDPAAANALISEMMNIILCSNGVYDCNRLDNLCIAIRAMIAASADDPRECYRALFPTLPFGTTLCEYTRQQIDDAIYGCLTRQFPRAEAGCSIDQLVAFNDGTCSRIGLFSSGSATITDANPSSVWPAGTAQFSSPPNPGDANSYYDHFALFAAQQSNSVDYNRLNQSLLARITLTLTCATRLTHHMTWNTVLNPAGVATSTIAIRTNGVFLNAGNGTVDQFGQISNYTRVIESTRSRTYAAGQYTFEYYAVAYEPGIPPAQYVNAVPTAGTITVSRTVN